MKKNILLFILLIGNLASAQKVAIFGDAIYKTKIKTIYYRFDNEKFSQNQTIPIQRSSSYGKKFVNDYRKEFDEKELRKHSFIYFSNSISNLKDTILVNQNRLNLLELFSLLDSLETDNEKAIANDLFLDEHFEALTKSKVNVNEQEAKYVGNYSVRSYYGKGKNEITLSETKQYYLKCTDEINSPFFLNEEIGKWELGTFLFNSDIKAIKISQIYRFNRRIGNKSGPADFGSSYDILIRGDRLLYPTGSEAFNELKRK